MVEEFVEIGSEWEVLTPSGWQPFQGVKRISGVPHRIRSLTWEGGGTLTCTGAHQVLVQRGDEIQFLVADLVEVGDLVFGDGGEEYKVLENVLLEESSTEPVYDLVNVAGGFRYQANGITVHNCAHISGMEELWAAIFPTISEGGRAVLISTPNGVGNTFHKIWTDSKAKENDFYPIELPWTVHPERDQRWFDQQKRILISDRLVAQELLCDFATSGKSFLSGEVIRGLEQWCKLPIGYWETNQDLWVWRFPEPQGKYLITADVARGDAEDSSACHVVNMTTDEVVADFKGKIQPDRFGDLLNEVGRRYNDALIAVENNGVGVATAYKLKELKYPNLYYQKHAKFGVHTTYDPDQVLNECPGFYLDSKNRVEVLAYLDQALRNQKIRIYSQRFFDELKTFVWNDNNKAKALKGYHDDQVMSLGLACYLYEASGRNSDDRADIKEVMLSAIGTSIQTLNLEVPVYTDQSLRSVLGTQGPNRGVDTRIGPGGWAQWIKDLG